MWYYGQKRGGKSGLIPFPRVGRSGPNTWQLDEESDSPGKSSPEYRRNVLNENYIYIF